MLSQILLFSFLLFGFTYPLCFLLTARNPITHHFHRFHLAAPVVMVSLAMIFLGWFPLSGAMRWTGLALMLAGLGLLGYFWDKKTVEVRAVSAWCILGLFFYGKLFLDMFKDDHSAVYISILGGCILSAILYAMNLGHFYLNVHGLDIRHLQRATKTFAVLVFLRLLWDVYYLLTGRILYFGQEVNVWPWIWTMDGFMLLAALFFGTVFPLIAVGFAFGTLKLKNTQATTGILYVILSAVLLGDLAYKYYLIKFKVMM